MILSYDVVQLATTSVKIVAVEKFPYSVIMVPIRVMLYVPKSVLLLVSIVSLPVLIG